jgi:putative transcriptional regulator
MAEPYERRWHHKKSAKKAPDTFGWPGADAMTDEQIHAAALADPGVQPLTGSQVRQMKPVPQVKLLRIRLRLTQGQFAKRYGAPSTILRDWEQGRSEPDQAVQPYISAIDGDPEGVARALGKRRQAELA